MAIGLGQGDSGRRCMSLVPSALTGDGAGWAESGLTDTVSLSDHHTGGQDAEGVTTFTA